MSGAAENKLHWSDMPELSLGDYRVDTGGNGWIINRLMVNKC
jgi:hypothetical protein